MTRPQTTPKVPTSLKPKIESEASQALVKHLGQSAHCIPVFSSYIM